MGRRFAVTLAGLSLVAAAAAPAAAQGPTITQVVSGLDTPRGVAVAADGTIYVAESGQGGTDPCLTSPELGKICFGATGGISAVKDGAATRIVDKLPSAVTGTGEVLGASDVTIGADGTIWYLVGGPGEGAADARSGIPGGMGAGLGQLYKVNADGTSTSVADLVAYEAASNPDVNEPGNTVPDSNAESVVATADGAVVADAGGNDLLQVAADGTISTLAVFHVVMQAAPPDPTAPSPSPGASPAMVPMDPVPTSVVVGPDGAYYVGQLTGFPFPAGGASVWKVVPGQEPTVYASGFTNIMDLAFGPDGTLYVLEIAHDGLLAAFGAMQADPTTQVQGGLWKVPAGGGAPELITSEGLVTPGGLAVAGDGTVYISTCTLFCPPGAGSIVSLKP